MSGSSITDFQVEVARVFFAMPEAGSFLLAGGLAIAAHGLTERPTEDLDVFTSKAGDVAVAVEAFTRAVAERQWMAEPTRCRLLTRSKCACGVLNDENACAHARPRSVRQKPFV
jgi:hypothetical protein